MKMKHCFALIAACTVFTALCGRAVGYPTSCNTIPTADILEAGTVRLEFENDGLPRVGGQESVTYCLTQIGLTPRVEFGIDRWDVSGEPQDAVNAKYLLAAESGRRPAVAIGVMDVAEGSPASWYGVATRTLGRLRLHAGYIHADYAKGPMLGCDHELAEGTYFLADWMRGPENYLALGIWRELGRQWALGFTYAFSNDRGAEDLTAVNLSYRFQLSPRQRPSALSADEAVEGREIQ